MSGIAAAHRLTRLSARFRGVPVTGRNPGWRGHVGASAPFVAVALVRAGTTVFWGKTEVAPRKGLSVILHLHPIDGERPSVQILFTLGSRMIGGASAALDADRLPAVRVGSEPVDAGRPFRLCTLESRPACTCLAFFLAASDVTTDRTGVWRPYKRLRSALPQALEPALFGGPFGVYSTSPGGF